MQVSNAGIQQSLQMAAWVPSRSPKTLLENVDELAHAFVSARLGDDRLGADRPEGIEDNNQLHDWIQRAVKFVGKLPAK